jgi:hypothetical protein
MRQANDKHIFQDPPDLVVIFPYEWQFEPNYPSQACWRHMLHRPLSSRDYRSGQSWTGLNVHQFKTLETIKLVRWCFSDVLSSATYASQASFELKQRECNEPARLFLDRGYYTWGVPSRNWNITTLPLCSLAASSGSQHFPIGLENRARRLLRLTLCIGQTNGTSR